MTRARYLDQLKVALTGLVVIHHLAITFGASGSWYYRDPSAPDSLGLSILAGLDQSFFMGLFFFISGYFTPGSLDRKRSAKFLGDRAIRLLAPALGFAIVIAPGLEYVKRTSLGIATPSLLEYYPERLADIRELDPGPLWFTWALFLFNVGYVVLRRPSTSAPRLPWWLPILGMAALTVAIRVRWPVGENVLHIQVAYLPQYVVMFAAGIVAARRRSLDQLPARLGWLGLALAAAGLVAWLAAGVTADGHLERVLGGAHPPAVLYAAGESLLCVGLSTALIVGFQRRGRPPNRIADALAGGAFATYVLHPPILVAIALALTPLAAPPLVKLAIAAAVALPCCFAVGIAAHHVPGFRRIL